MYQALYRKWRPKYFADVVGQPHVTETLKNEISQGRVVHAYLFIGSRGTGKTTCAKIFAKAVNCINHSSGDPCMECEICKEAENSTLVDIVELDAASNNSVNDIRAICESAEFTPAKAKYRVYIIDEVHMLSIGAFNALLKTLEEPPDHVIFILATTESHKVPATILSRCQRFEFHRISVDNMSERLGVVAKGEGISIEASAARLISSISDGAMRDAISILDKCMGSGGSITEDIVVQVVGLAPKEQLLHLGEAVINKNTSEAISVVVQLNNQSKDMARLCDELIGFFRVLMHIKSLKDPQGLLGITESECERYRRLSRGIEIAEVLHIMDTLIKSRERISRGYDARCEFEMCLVKLCDLGAGAKHCNETHRKNQIEAKSDLREDTKSTNKSTNVDSRKPEEAALSQPVDNEASVLEESSEIPPEKMEQWGQVLDELRASSPTIAAAFKGSVAYIRGDLVLIDSQRDVAFELLRKSSQRDKLRLAIKEVTGRFCRLGPYRTIENSGDTKDPLDGLAEFASGAGINVTIT